MTNKQLQKAVIENLDKVKHFYENSKDNQFFSTMFLISSLKDSKERNIAFVMGNAKAMEMRSKVIFDLGIRTGVELFHKDIDSVEAVYLMSEGWASEPVKKKGDNEVYGRPSLDPNKKEIIISTGLSKEKDSALEIVELKRSIDLKSGKMKVDFKPLESMKKNMEKTKKDKGIHIDSPLLERFWEGFEMTNILFKDMPETLNTLARTMTVDRLFNMILSQMQLVALKMKNKS